MAERTNADPHRLGPRCAGGLLATACAAILGASLVPAAAADCRSMAASGIDWQGCSKGGLVLGDSDLSGAKLKEVDFTATDLRGATLSGADLEEAKLIRSSLAGAKADKANFKRIEGYRTVFSGIAAPGASFASAELQRADFSDADLTGADFQKAELGRANFAGATITGTKFPMANLSRAEMQKANFEGPIDFTGAFLFLTRLDGLDLSQATGLAQPQIDLACGDAGTKLPAGLTPPLSWPCKFEFD
jgi:uncharacterized protein YjbI with pentapeptide repeats